MSIHVSKIVYIWLVNNLAKKKKKRRRRLVNKANRVKITLKYPVKIS